MSRVGEPTQVARFNSEIHTINEQEKTLANLEQSWPGGCEVSIFSALGSESRFTQLRLGLIQAAQYKL